MFGNYDPEVIKKFPEYGAFYDIICWSRIHKERSAEHESFPAREAEALIRAALGEVRFLEDVRPGCFSYSEIGIAVLGCLFQGWFPDASEARSFLHGVDEGVAAAHGCSRGLAVLESAWLAAGMHDSPSCVRRVVGRNFVDNGRQELAGMRFRNSARPPAEAEPEPRTVVGRWLLAGLLNQVGERNRLLPMLNGGESGWNYDEPGTVEAVCEIAVRRYFRRDADIREITAFVSEFRGKIHSVKPPGQLEAEALVRMALGDPDVVVDNISFIDTFTIQAGVALQVVRKLGLDPPEVRQLVIDGERLAFKRGWNPPLYT